MSTIARLWTADFELLTEWDTADKVFITIDDEEGPLAVGPITVQAGTMSTPETRALSMLRSLWDTLVELGLFESDPIEFHVDLYCDHEADDGDHIIRSEN